MAEIATGVLHNVGNALNSVNVSAALVAEQLPGSRIQGLVRATELLQEHAADLGDLPHTDAQGRASCPSTSCALSRQLAEEHAAMLEEMQALTKNVEHIQSVVACSSSTRASPEPWSRSGARAAG